VSLAEDHPTIRNFIYRSFSEVYRVSRDRPCLVGERHPLVFDSTCPQCVRDRVEADVTVSARIGLSPLRIIVLRLAELFAPESGSQLYDYVSSRVCLRPLGYDPMINLLSLDDAVRAMMLAAKTRARGIFNIAGRDLLPISRLIALAGCRDIPVPGPLLEPLYRLRTRTIGREFSYASNARRFHLGAILDGTLARRQLGYEPEVGVNFPSWRPGPSVSTTMPA
jgi:UDP-glucose 4-epimerase